MGKISLCKGSSANYFPVCSRETEDINVFNSQSLETEAWMATKQSIDDLHFMAAVIRRSSVQSENYDLLS